MGMNTNRISVVILGDFLAFWISFLIIVFTRFNGSLIPIPTIIQIHLIPFSILYLSWILVFYLFELYNLFKIKPTIPHFRRFGIALVSCFILGIFLFYLVPIFGISPKTNLFFQIIGFTFFSLIFRRLIYIVFSSQISRPVILVGKNKYFEELYETINHNPQIGLKIVSYTTDLQKALEKFNAIKNAVFIFESISNEIPEKEIINLYKNKTEIIDIAEAYERYLVKIPIEYITTPWIVKNINTKSNLLHDFLIRIFDIVFSILILIITSPFLIISGIFIYLYDRGSIFYIHKRVGLNGKVFKLYKLRSMYDTLEKNPDADGESPLWHQQNDKRVTPVGKIIRKLHIDEVPQMINILNGDITLIGPRPEHPDFVKLLEKSIPHYELRHIIRPGFTGWAQIKYQYARTIEDSREKFEYDMYYIKNRNIFLNLGIILKTIQIVFTH